MALTPLSSTHVPPGEYVIQVNTAFGKERSAATGDRKTTKGLKLECEPVSFAFSKVRLTAL